MEFVSINKLFEKLPEEELKAVQVYYDECITDNSLNIKSMLRYCSFHW